MLGGVEELRVKIFESKWTPKPHKSSSENRGRSKGSPLLSELSHFRLSGANSVPSAANAAAAGPTIIGARAISVHHIGVDSVRQPLLPPSQLPGQQTSFQLAIRQSVRRGESTAHHVNYFDRHGVGRRRNGRRSCSLFVCRHYRRSCRLPAGAPFTTLDLHCLMTSTSLVYKQHSVNETSNTGQQQKTDVELGIYPGRWNNTNSIAVECRIPTSSLLWPPGRNVRGSSSLALRKSAESWSSLSVAGHA